MLLFICGEAAAQGTGFAVSGQGRGSQADAKQGAQIDQLYDRDRAQQTELDDHETRITTSEGRLSDVETTCSPDEKLRWTGSAWQCADEQDPTVGAHGKTGEPPDCNDNTAKLLWNASTNSWHCVADRNDGTGGGYGAGYETDPQVGNLVSGELCRSNGSRVICDGNVSWAGVPTCHWKNQKLRWNGSNWVCNADQGITSESDPQVGALNNGKWCRASGGQVRCTYDEPSGSSSGGSCVSNTGQSCTSNCCSGTITCSGSCSTNYCSGCGDRGDW